MNDNYEDYEDVWHLIQISKMMANGRPNLYKVGNNSIKLFDTNKQINALKAAKAVKTSSDLGTNFGSGATLTDDISVINNLIEKLESKANSVLSQYDKTETIYNFIVNKLMV